MDVCTVLAKVLADGLRLVIGNVVCKRQPIYVKGKQILDRIAIANELADDAKRRKGGTHSI